MRYFDAHNHLQDERFGGQQAELLKKAAAAGVVRMVVNGACEEDWPAVIALGQNSALVIPSLGFHPWYLHEQAPGWLERLDGLLAATGAAVGEIGLDRWILDQPARVRAGYVPALAAMEPAPLESQAEAFMAQLQLAVKHGVPASIHCLQAWGRLEELLRQGPRPRHFVLHSYGGPAEMVPVLAKLGAFFSFPGYFLHERKTRHREVFKRVPLDRLLVETDAPDQLPPEDSIRFPLASPATGKALNHPANLGMIYTGLAGFLGLSVADLAAQVEANFQSAFGKWARAGNAGLG